MKAFKAYDIRGIYNKDFDKNDVYKIGYFLPKLLKADKVMVGRDVRESSPEIFDYLTKGIMDAGVDVFNIGLATTPMVYYSTAKHGFDASVQITASHNPKEYNGLKISKTGALPVGYESGLAELEQMILEFPVHPAIQKGQMFDFDAKSSYLEFFKKYTPDIQRLNIAIDCSNGMSALLIKEILGNTPEYIFDTLDGTFPNHEPNPLEEENVHALKELVAKKKADIGIIFDGDADRVMFVDEKSQFIPPDLIIGVLSHYFLTKEKGNVLQDIRTSKAVGEYVEKMGGKMTTWKVGHAYAKIKLREINGIFGGELAGHYYYRDFYYCDSGILTALLVLQVVNDFKQKGIRFSEIISRIKTYSNSGEINFRIENKQKAMERLKEHFTQSETILNLFDFDGYRLEFKEWWFNIRPSNTEPYLRLVMEAKSEELLQEKLTIIKQLLNEFV